MRDFRVDLLASRVVFGPGWSRTRLAEEVALLGAARVLVVSTEQEQELATELIEPIGAGVVGHFTGVRPHVPGEVVAEVMELVAQAGVDGILSIGGGSTTGTAKAIALRTGLAVLAVPTTYAGSEMTPVWGMTEAGRKTTGRSAQVQPRTVLYDPELTLTLPVGLTVSSAMNAVAHCVEAFYAAGSNPLTDLFAAEGIRAVAAGLPGVVDDPTDVEARSELLYGACLAGSAFAVAGSGLHHKICHVLGGAFDLPHAETHAIVLPQVTAFYEPVVEALRRWVAPALGQASAAAGLAALGAQAGAPTALRDIGLPLAGIDTAVSEVLAKDLSGPRPVNESDVRRILTDAYYGKEPS